MSGAKLKVAIINRHPRDVLGGSEMQCHNIAMGLSRRGHEVLYVAPHSTGAHDLPYKVASVDASPVSIVAAVKDWGADVVYWRFNRYIFFRTVRQLARMDVPVVFAISHVNDTRILFHTVNPRTSIANFARAVKQVALNAFNYLGFRYVSAVTTLNPDFMGLLPIARQKFVPNSVEMESVPFSWPRPYVVWVANLKPAKRPELYVKLAQELARMDVDFLMVGDIQFKEYEWLANGSGSGIKFLGKKGIAEVSGIIASAICLIQTCRPEGFGNNFLQAWLQGVPTISLGFDPGGYIQAFDLGGFAAEDWDAFKRQVECFIESPDVAALAGLRARAFSEARFSIDRTVDSLEEFLREVITSDVSARRKGRK